MQTKKKIRDEIDRQLGEGCDWKPSRDGSDYNIVKYIEGPRYEYADAKIVAGEILNELLKMRDIFVDFMPML